VVLDEEDAELAAGGGGVDHETLPIVARLGRSIVDRPARG
jgi:hypothetical protein